jgi:hypothetical protein
VFNDHIQSKSFLKTHGMAFLFHRRGNEAEKESRSKIHSPGCLSSAISLQHIYFAVTQERKAIHRLKFPWASGSLKALVKACEKLNICPI